MSSVNAQKPNAAGAGQAKCDLQGGDGKIRIYSEQKDQFVEFNYLDQTGNLRFDALNQFARITASPDGTLGEMNSNLLFLLDKIQDHFGVDTIEVISGYRSRNYNNNLKMEGRNVATKSMHMYGQAIDLHIDEVDEKDLRDYARKLGCGGVGFYPNLHFVHIDFGNVREWTERALGRKLVGKGPIVIQTDRNYYIDGGVVKLSRVAEKASPLSAVARSADAEGNWILQLFRRGKWQDVRPLGEDRVQIILKAPGLAYGKYRVRIGGKESSYSNEFYLKKTYK